MVLSGSELESGDAISPLSASETADTPPTVTEGVWDGLNYAIPWPNNTYIIIEKDSGLAIALKDGKIDLYDFHDRRDINIQWLCVERNGYFAFLNTKSGVYMGHNGSGTVQASATTPDAWELIIPRKHPGGGYQLLSPHWWNTLKVIEVAEDRKSLVRRLHGTTVWEFIKV